MFCGNCGNEIKDEENFCGKCGNRVHRLETDVKKEVVGEHIQTKKIKEKKCNVKRIVITMLGIIVIFGIGFCFWINVQEDERKASSVGKTDRETRQEEQKTRHDKSYVSSGNYDAAKSNLGSLGYVLKDEEGITGDIDKDGADETILFYIDGKNAYIELNGETAYVYSCDVLCEDYLIILPVGDDMMGFILTKRNERKDAYFSKLVCFYKGKSNSEYEFTLDGSVADGGLIVEEDYAVHYDWQTSSERIFYNGKLYDQISW